LGFKVEEEEEEEKLRRIQRIIRRDIVPQTSKSAVSWVFKPADAAPAQRPADLEIGEPKLGLPSADWETCDTLVSPASACPTME